jgi:hypothetical protein
MYLNLMRVCGKKNLNSVGSSKVAASTQSKYRKTDDYLKRLHVQWIPNHQRL